MNTIKHFLKVMGTVADRYFASDMEVISPEARRILSNPDDKKKYLDAVERLKGQSKKETIKLSTGETITLVS